MNIYIGIRYDMEIYKLLIMVLNVLSTISFFLMEHIHAQHKYSPCHWKLIHVEYFSSAIQKINNMFYHNAMGHNIVGGLLLFFPKVENIFLSV